MARILEHGVQFARYIKANVLEQNKSKELNFIPKKQLLFVM